MLHFWNISSMILQKGRYFERFLTKIYFVAVGLNDNHYNKLNRNIRITSKNIILAKVNCNSILMMKILAKQSLHFVETNKYFTHGFITEQSTSMWCYEYESTMRNFTHLLFIQLRKAIFDNQHTNLGFILQEISTKEWKDVWLVVPTNIW